MCLVSAIGTEWSKTVPERWPSIPIGPQVPYVPPAPHELPHPFQMLQNGSCEVCGFGRNHWSHALFEPTLDNDTDEDENTGVTREEFEALRKEMLELRELLKAAKKFDAETGQPDCEMDEKVEPIKRVAELVGVDMEDVFGAESCG